MGDSKKFKGHNPSKNLLKDNQNFKKRNVKKGGSNKKKKSAIAAGSPHPPLLNAEVFLKYLLDYFSRN